MWCVRPMGPNIKCGNRLDVYNLLYIDSGHLASPLPSHLSVPTRAAPGHLPSMGRYCLIERWSGSIFVFGDYE